MDINTSMYEQLENMYIIVIIIIGVIIVTRDVGGRTIGWPQLDNKLSEPPIANSIPIHLPPVLYL